MSIAVSCECGRRYNLKDDLAGQLVQCPECGATLSVTSVQPAPQADEVFDRDRFLVLQKRISLHAKYYVWDEDQNVILFVERPVLWLRSIYALGMAMITGIVLTISVIVGLSSLEASAVLVVPGIVLVALAAVAIYIWLSPKRHVFFYRDDSRAERLLTVVQDTKNPIVARYTVADAGGEPLGCLRKNYLMNFIRRRWTCHTPDGQPLCLILEDSIILSLLRRLIGPLFGLLRTNFIILSGDGSSYVELGQFNRKFTLFDRYVLDMTADPARSLDRRLAIAIGVMLDTGERR
jgi:hypothetical protein